MQFFVLLTVGLIFASTTVYSREVIKFTPMNGMNCVIKNVRVNPCTFNKNTGICVIRKNDTATLTFDYTTGFNSAKPKGKAFALTHDKILPFEMDDDACENTSCPITANTSGKYENTLPVLENYSTGTFTVMMRLWDSEKPENICEFTFNITVLKN